MVVLVLACFLLASSALELLVGGAGSRVNRPRSDLAVLSGAIDQFKLDTGRYPTEKEGLSVLTDCPLDHSKGWCGPYLHNDLKKVHWGRLYVYRLGKVMGFLHYTVTYLGADGNAGGTGEDADLVDGG